VAFNKTAETQVENPIISLDDWSKIVPARSAFGRKTASSLNKLAADQSKYLLSHTTIMASVCTEADPYDFLIKPESAALVNSNSDAWTNEVLKLSYKSFIGAFNFLEHFQNSKHAKGHILDAVLRKVALAPPDIWVYFCDILVATDLSHESLISDIRSGKQKYFSMGCVTDLVICSFCGAHITDASSYCHHLQFQKSMFLPDEDGVPRIIGELCGHKSLPNGGVRFVEASWVGTPAFPGAVLRNIVQEEFVGPKTPYTAKAARATESFQKAASAANETNTEYQTPILESAIRAGLHRRFL
jgi:hypothetical protein